ncbi:MAG: type II secretion system protein [Rhodocyclaceae bacterium]|nr:MAG: type II secretion system protein [Rhodocyclaceae bacterium]
MSASRCLQRGITLVELIVFIVVVSVGIAGVLSTIGPMVRDSANPMIRKQMAAVAESLLLEILRQPFTYCDPDDANAATATLSGTTPTCAVAANSQALAASPQAGETRLGPAFFENVADYQGYTQTPVTDSAGAGALNGYTASVAITTAGASFGLSAEDALQVAVTVNFPSGTEPPLVLSAYRFRYAPRY